MLALQAIEADLGPHGIPMSEATDPRNEYEFETNPAPLIDFAARSIGQTSRAYYDKYDANKQKPMDRSGHIWRTRKKT